MNAFACLSVMMLQACIERLARRWSSSLRVGIGDSKGKPTRWFLLASTTDILLLQALDLHVDLQNRSKTSSKKTQQ